MNLLLKQDTCFSNKTSKPVRAGLLTEIVDIYRPTVTTNTLGEQVTVYNHVHTYRAHVVHRSRNRENIQGDVVYPNTHNLQMRIYVDIEDNDIIKFQDRYYRQTQAPLKDRVLQCVTLEIEQTLEEITLVPTTNGNTH